MINRNSLLIHLQDRRQNNFNLIRLIAAILVIVSHAFGNSDPLYKLSSGHIYASYLGLRMFFFLSGLLVSKSYIQSSSPLNFAWKRILRLYPAAILVILLSACLLGPLTTTLAPNAYFKHPQFFQYLRTCSLIKIYYFLPGVFQSSPLGPVVNGSLWTLSLELKLYAAVLLAGYIRNNKVYNTLMAICLFALLAIDFFYSRLLKEQMTGVLGRDFVLSPYSQLAVFFILGVLCQRFSHRISISNSWLLAVPVAGLVLIFSPSLFEPAFLLLLPMLLLYLAVNNSSWLRKITPTADLSYGIYLFAWPVEQLEVNYLHLDKPIALFLVNIALVVPLAAGSWYLVESKALQLKKLIK